MSTEKLLVKQLERRLAPWSGVSRTPPKEGWLHTIRKALGMTAPQLADRIGMTRQGVADLEQREREGAVTLAALRQAGDAMNCDLVYALVPRKRLTDVLSEQARQMATKEVERIAHSMRLENQETGIDEIGRLIEERADQLLRGSRRGLWTRARSKKRPTR